MNLADVQPKVTLGLLASRYVVNCKSPDSCEILNPVEAHQRYPWKRWNIDQVPLDDPVIGRS
jgi:hypothetical protein